MRRKRRKRYAIRCTLTAKRLADIAGRARYVGSPEHKAYPSDAGPPALRSDATPCDPTIAIDSVQEALTEAIRRGCISEAAEQGFPRYVWGWLGGDLYEARHINGPAGTYKAYMIDETEYPRDDDDRLSWHDP